MSWSPPDHAGGGTLTGYVAGVSGDTALSCTAGPSDTACVVTGLKNDSAYVMEVRARNPVGLGSAKVHATAAFPSFFTTWTRVNISVNFLNGITWTGNQFVVSGGGGALYTSPDGITWTNRSLGVGYSLWSVAAGNGILVVVGDGGLVRTSTDGVVWTSRVAPHTSGPSFRKVIWTGTKFVAVGFSYLNGGTVGTTLTSPDGVNWISGVAGEHPNALLSAAWMPLYSVTPGTGLIVGVGVSGLLRTSPDGSAWTTRASGTNRSLNGIAYGTPASIGATGQRVGVGDGGTVIRSLDGAVWTDQQVGTANILSVVWNGAHFVAIAADGTVHHSADGVAWRSTPTSHGFSNGSAWNGARLAVTIENGILLSPPIH